MSPALKDWLNSASRFLGGAVLGLALALLIAFNGLLLWVATGPRTLDSLTPLIESAITPPGSEFTLEIGQTILIWDGWKHPIDIRLRNVSVLTRSQQRFSRFPEISIGLDVLELLRGRILPSAVSINHPVISLYQKEDRSISFGFQAEPESDQPPAPPSETLPLALLLGQLLEPDSASPLRKLRSVTILDADVSVGNTHSGVFFKAADANLVFKKNRRGLTTYGSAKLTYDQHQTLLELRFSRPRDAQLITGEINFGEIMPGLLSDLFTHKNEISGIQLPLRGKVGLGIDMSGTLQSLSANIDGGKGRIVHERFAQPLALNGLHLEASLTDGLNKLAVKDIQLFLPKEARVQAQLAANLTKGAMDITGKASASRIRNNALGGLWPLGLAPLSREWVTENISEGEYEQADVNFHITQKDIDAPILPKEAIDAKVKLTAASIKYLPDHPEVRAVNATIHIDGLSLTANIDSADYLKESKLSTGLLNIPDLNEDNPYITLDFAAASTAREVVHFLGFPRLGHTQRLGLSESAASGTVSGRAKLGFHFFTPEGVEDDIAYDITADVKDVSQPKFLGKFDISSATGTIAVNNQKVTYTGTGEVNAAKASKVDITYLFKPENGLDTFIETTADAPASSLPRFGYPNLDMLEGTLGVKASVKIGAKTETSTATIDLKNTAIDFKPIHYKKEKGTPATLEFTAEKVPGGTNIPSFRLSGKELDGKGTAAVESGNLSRVTFDSLTHGKTSLAPLRYEALPGGFKLFARGKTGDLTPWFASEKGQEGSFTFQHFPAIDLDMQVTRLILAEGRELKGVSGTMRCDVQRCSGADIKGATADDKPFHFRLFKNPKGKRQVSLRAEGAGAFLKAVGVFDSMEGGDFSLTGTFNDSEGGSALKGRIDSTAFTVKNAPVLAKMLSLASLTGFFDTLSGKGIAFTRLRAPFTLSKDVLTFREAKTHGDAMGMTAEGTITFPRQEMNLKGTIVPSYSMNTVLGKVPIIGTALMGGEGKGVFAASYSIKGLGSDPQVTVNPLSILTPGFLRGLFDIFDKPMEEEEDSQ